MPGFAEPRQIAHAVRMNHKLLHVHSGLGSLLHRMKEHALLDWCERQEIYERPVRLRKMSKFGLVETGQRKIGSAPGGRPRRSAKRESRAQRFENAIEQTRHRASRVDITAIANLQVKLAA